MSNNSNTGINHHEGTNGDTNSNGFRTPPPSLPPSSPPVAPSSQRTTPHSIQHDPLTSPDFTNGNASRYPSLTFANARTRPHNSTMLGLPAHVEQPFITAIEANVNDVDNEQNTSNTDDTLIPEVPIEERGTFIRTYETFQGTVFRPRQLQDEYFFFQDDFNHFDDGFNRYYDTDYEDEDADEGDNINDEFFDNHSFSDLTEDREDHEFYENDIFDTDSLSSNDIDLIQFYRSRKISYRNVEVIVLAPVFSNINNWIS